MTNTDTSEDTYASITASPPRRWFGVLVMALLGGLVVYLALTTAPTPLWRVFLVLVGAGALWLAEATRRATMHSIILSDAGLFSSTGEEIAHIDNIADVKRGTFDMKPSNGFTLVLKNRRTRRWQPGMWWAHGRRVGIGGVTPGSETKATAHILQAMLAERRGRDSES